ncbi:hypothetical protein G7Y89_g1533 [Cudoniella acicularis]|uniref:Major facilitator superfamily (MFS) profile domain-containing protein n=1 Tax=Cudoniella acicularis TaxID=354080 RepID=A0A8H4WA71_9HELO|nr:hypothetical protein G7Y89_g1533 [Cudoniella acicularis]
MSAGETTFASDELSTPSTEDLSSQPNPEKNKSPDGSLQALQSGGFEVGEEEAVYPGTLTRSLLILGISCSAFLVALDRTIVASAIPHITDDFKSPSDAGWYGSAYLLTSCAFQPTFGRVFTNFNVRWSFLAALGVFELGSLLCGAAPNSDTLIVGRAIAGIGCAGVFAGCLLIITLCIPLAKRPVYMAGVGGIFGLGSIAGPVIGGAFTENISWRWCFYINLPIGAVTTLIVLFFFHPAQKTNAGTFLERIVKLDLVGNFLLISAIVMLLLALQWGGDEYAWNSATTIGLIVGAVIELCIFIAWQIYRGPEALVRPEIVSQRTVAASLVFGFFLSGALLVHTYYIPYWFQAIENASAEKSGINMIPYLLSNFVFSIIAGITVQRTGYVLPAAILSPLVAVVGSGLIITFSETISTARWAGYTVLAGAGVGIGMQQGVVAVQSVLPRDSVAIGTALVLFVQSLSGAIFVSVGNSILRNELSMGLDTAKLPGVDIPKVLSAGATAVRQLVPDAELGAFLSIYNSALQKVFIVAVPLAGVSLLGAVFIEWKSIKDKEIMIGGE